MRRLKKCLPWCRIPTCTRGTSGGMSLSSRPRKIHQYTAQNDGKSRIEKFDACCMFLTSLSHLSAHGNVDVAIVAILIGARHAESVNKSIALLALKEWREIIYIAVRTLKFCLKNRKIFVQNTRKIVPFFKNAPLT